MKPLLGLLLATAVVGCGSEKPDVTTVPTHVKPKTTPDVAAVKKQIQPALGDHVVNSIGMILVPIPAGEFTMANPDEQAKAHQVKISKPFHLGAFEVTQGQYEKVMGQNPSHFKGANKPIETVNWDEAVEFCHKLSALPEEIAAGRAYRLPTEAEWEYACRAGTTTKYSFGDDENQLGEYAWFFVDSYTETHPVGEKKRNAWGLHDMHGNVSEWCQDWCGDYPNGIVTDPAGPTTGSVRVIRGGSWSDFAWFCRSGNRGGLVRGYRSGSLGFRVALVPLAKKPASGAKPKE